MTRTMLGLGQELWTLRCLVDPWDDAVVGVNTAPPTAPLTAGLDRVAVQARALQETAEMTVETTGDGDPEVGYMVIAEQALDVWVKSAWKLLFRFVNGYDYSIVGKLLGTYAQMSEYPRTCGHHLDALDHVPKLLEEAASIQVDLVHDGWGYAPTALRAARERLSSPSQAAAVIIGAAKPPAQVRRNLETALATYARALDHLSNRGARPESAPGLSSSEAGDDLYSWLIRVHTGKHIPPEELMMRGEERLAHLNDHLPATSTVKARHFASPEALREHAERFSNTLLQQVADASGIAVPTDCRILAQPAGQTSSAPLAYYVPAGDQPATLFLNTDAYDEITIEDLECVLTHEVAPGHHFQFAQYRPDLPAFQSAAWFTSTIEGWGLFAEQVAIPLGLVNATSHGPAHRRQNLLRAARLVVDPGLHAQGWRYDDAVRYLQDAAELSPHVAAREVDRYLEYPGQALAYEAGRAQINDLLDPTDIDWLLVRTLLEGGTLPLSAWRSIASAYTARTPKTAQPGQGVATPSRHAPERD